MGYNYAQGHSVSPPHPWRASALLKSSQRSVSEFLLVVGCVGFWTGTGVEKFEWDTLLNYVGFCFFFSYVNSVLFFCPARWAGVRFFVLDFSTQLRWAGVMWLVLKFLFSPPGQAEPVQWFLFSGLPIFVNMCVYFAFPAKLSWVHCLW